MILSQNKFGVRGEIMTSLEKSIIATICYYDTLNYPLTGFEIYKYLVNLSSRSFTNRSRIDNRKYITNISLNNILDALEKSLKLRAVIQEKNGFYFLRNRGKIVSERIKRQKLADQKWKKAEKIIQILQIIPYLRMIAVSGSLALGNTRKNSDIDLLIVTKAGRVWICRTLITILITLLGKKRRQRKTRDKICLNHYITDQSLKIPFKSLYNAQTYVCLVDVYENMAKMKNNSFFRQFQKANSWVKDYLVFWFETKAGNLRTVKKNKILIAFAEFLEMLLNNKIGNWIERKLGKWQKKRIKANPLCKKSGGRITVDESQLEFHPNSHEVRIIKDFNRQMKNLGFPELANQKDSGLNL